MRRYRRTTYVLLLAFGTMPLESQSRFRGVNWLPLGPAPVSGGQTLDGRMDVGGRASVIAVNPVNPNDVWLGTANGGIWHSTSGGAHWTPMSDTEESLAIGSIALAGCSPAGCSTVYAGTGENAIRRDTYYGAGVLIGGLRGTEFQQFVWTQLGRDLFRFASINNLVLDPSTSGSTQRIYVALSSGVTASASESTLTAPAPPMGYGIYKSENNGSTWAKLSVAGSGGAKPTDLEIDPQSNTTMYAGFLGQGIFKTTDGGSTWCPLNPGIALPAGCVASTGLPDPTSSIFDWVQTAIFHPNPASPATLYATFGNCPDPIGNGPSIGGLCNPSLYKSTDGGATWALRNSSTPDSYSRYTHALTIDPTDSTHVFLGAYTISESTDSGGSFTEIGAAVHPDHHALVFPDPSKPNRIYDTSDGGFAYTADGGTGWTSGNTDLEITAFQSISSSPLTGRAIGGSQDNGTEMWTGLRTWQHIDDGDAASTVMGRDSALNMFDNYFEACPRRSTTGGVLGSFDLITFGINTYFNCYAGGPFASLDPAAVYAPMVQDPTPPYPLYFGTNLLYQTTDNGTDWNPVSPALGGTGIFYPDINRSNVITAIAVAPNNHNRIYIGYYDGQIWVTDGACVSASCWRSVGGASHGLPNAIVTRIAVDPTNFDRAYVTYSGFNIGAHVYKTLSGGSSWSAASGSGAGALPDIPTNTISIEPSAPSNLWLGTDGAVMNGAKGSVFKSTDFGSSWAPFSSGLPNSPVYEISIDETHGRIYAATHGRGVYVITEPYLSNYEGWVNGGIWDIPVYGGGFIGLFPQSCTMNLIRQDGTICASGSTDAMGATIQIDNMGTLNTSNGSFYNSSPVAWACYNGTCLNGTNISACNQPGNPISTVTVTCGGLVGVDHVLNCPQENNPPSSGLGFGGAPGAPVSASRFASPRAVSSKAAAGTGSFDVIASVQAGDGTTRALCSADVPFHDGEDAGVIISRAGDALNNSPDCAAKTVKAIARGIVPAGSGQSEDAPGSDPRLFIAAPGVNGSQLFTGLHAAPGQATGSCFLVNGLGVPVLNSLTITRVTLETLAGGVAAGGQISMSEFTDLGTCTVSVPTHAGQSATQVAADLTNAFHIPGVPGPNPSCPSTNNTRDVTADGASLIAVAARGLEVCVKDSGIGFAILPEELPLGSITLSHPVRVLSFTASPETIIAGDSATLTWTTQNATDVTITNVGPVALNGSITVKPSIDTVYTINALGASGDASAFVLVKVIPAPRITVDGAVNAASYRGGPVAPGELLTIFGESLGPATGVGLQFDAMGLVATSLADVRVLFDGVPAPMIYAQSSQTSVVAPYEVDGKPQTGVALEYKGRLSNTITLPVAGTAAGMFTVSGVGVLQGAILNQDQRVNSSANPASKGSIVSLFATGAGQTTPPGVDGKVGSAPLPTTMAPVSVKIGGLDAEVLYAGAAPTLVAGVLQVNVRIPAGAPSGNVPVVITMGATNSQDGVTVAIR